MAFTRIRIKAHPITVRFIGQSTKAVLSHAKNYLHISRGSLNGIPLTYLYGILNNTQYQRPKSNI